MTPSRPANHVLSPSWKHNCVGTVINPYGVSAVNGVKGVLGACLWCQGHIATSSRTSVRIGASFISGSRFSKNV